MIRLTVPGTLEYRDVAMRVVTAAAKLVEPGPESDEFDAEVVSALGEAFNNIAIHGYADHGGEIEIEIDVQRDRMVLRMLEARFIDGRSFQLDPSGSYVVYVRAGTEDAPETKLIFQSVP